MAKVLFLIISGEKDKDKADLGIATASGAVEKSRYEDVKVLFYGASEEYIPKLEGQIKDHFDKLIKINAVDSACIGIAKMYNIEDQLKRLGVVLLPAGEQISHYVNNGYIVLSF